MELEIQRYLRSGKTPLELKEELCIKYSQFGNLLVFNYDQIKSPKTHPIVREARCLILEEGTWKIILKTMSRFYNHGEALGEDTAFNFTATKPEDIYALEKIDGSLLGIFFYDNTWLMTTRGVIEGNCYPQDSQITFRQLFYKTLEQYPKFWDACNENKCYTFELTSPENRVVTPYKDRSLHLLTARDTNTWMELDRLGLKRISEEMGVPTPKMYPFTNIQDLVRLAAGLNTLDEGFVCVNASRRNEYGDWSRLKVKNPAYLAIAHLKESSTSSTRALLQLVMTGETDEFLSYFPEFKEQVDVLQETWNTYAAQVAADLVEADTRKTHNRKDFAAWATRQRNPNILFQFYNGEVGGLGDWVDKCIEKKGVKNFSKNMLGVLDIKNIEWYGEEDV